MAERDTLDAGQAGSVVDLQYWAQMPGWRVAEAAALLLGLDPDSVTSAKGTNGSEPQRFVRLKRMMLRAYNMDQLDSPMSSGTCLEWASSNEIPIPKLLLDAVAKGKPLRNWKKRAQGYRRRLGKLELKSGDIDDVPAKSLHSLYSIILGIAVDKYKFDPEKNNSAATNIENTLAKVGLSEPKAETIRTWLQKAHEAVRG